jgi:hypothetical protein
MLMVSKAGVLILLLVLASQQTAPMVGMEVILLCLQVFQQATQKQKIMEGPYLCLEDRLKVAEVGMY